MAVSISRLRLLFGVMALIMVAVAGGFYLYARHELRVTLKDLPGKVGVNIQQSSEGFTLSKSEGGRTLFTIHAAKATQFKQGGRADLHDVNIVVYGRRSERYDQIYGKDFQYDQQAGTVIAKGEVHIDLEANAEGASDQGLPAPPHEQNPIHLRTDGMTFDQKTGVAESSGLVDFRVPQASGTAVGASYDSKKNELTMQSAVQIQTEGNQPTHITASRGSITKEPHQLTLDSAELTGTESKIFADRAVADLNEDNSIQQIHASGHVRMLDAKGLEVRSPVAELKVGDNNALEYARFSGGVDFSSEARGANGHSGELLVKFAADARPAAGAVQKVADKKAGSEGKPANAGGAVRPQVVYASQKVTLRQAAREGVKNPQNFTMSSEAMTLNIGEDRQLSSAHTEAAGQLVVSGAAVSNAGQQTVIDAQHFTADFGQQNRMQTVHGNGAVRVVSLYPGQPNKVSTSDDILAHFNSEGDLSTVDQYGNFHYKEAQSSPKEPGGRTGAAERATYSPQDESLTLLGHPRLVDGGVTVTADRIRLMRNSNEAFAEGSVKTTYSELKQQLDGALLATADPVHVTAQSMHAERLTGLAHYYGGARLWQASNIVEAPTIDFNSQSRTLLAQGDRKHPVTSVFLQVDHNGKSTTMLVTAPRLAYADNERQARYSGGVTARAQDGVMTADHADVFLNAATAAHADTPSQLDHIVAAGHVLVQQQERRAQGEKLVYTAGNGTYVMTGGSPLLSDPVNGTVRGDSLTFFSRDDRVIAEGNGASRTVTHTHVSR